MSDYTRPAVPEEVFRDEHGAVIAYGHRWGDDPPPEDAYSVDSNLERFSPLHLVAEALVAHLIATYDVLVEEDLAVAADVGVLADDGDLPGAGVVRAVRLTPRVADAAALTVVLLDDYSVLVHAGLLHDFPFPGCGCDACDATWHTEVDGLEDLVLAVAEGRYGERLHRRPRRWVQYALADRHGNVSSGRQVAHRVPRFRGSSARATLRRRRGGPWRPWARRP
ncbi:hypothetical protein SAMN05216184_11810 [Georgenia satyanarayanai]|uniref:Uncharacterized protein n=1 Tax=Georgenia satyanarayanai TaxID=860221 RepID=A0A2Y9APY3_9MICO|nr:DUF6226 family protein [Georgenia satyanarayanai]PYF96719.1 hypothetical protein A8987_11810 [Georgenia satyanarayanai]SSA46460.1 hypothetical protein SAMN05216184_11810 [Georgenia satyanarayanai]